MKSPFPTSSYRIASTREMENLSFLFHSNFPITYTDMGFRYREFIWKIHPGCRAREWKSKVIEESHLSKYL